MRVGEWLASFEALNSVKHFILWVWHTSGDAEWEILHVDRAFQTCYKAWSIRWRRSGNPARPYPMRFMSFNLLTFPSTIPLLAGKVKPALTAVLSRSIP